MVPNKAYWALSLPRHLAKYLTLTDPYFTEQGNLLHITQVQNSHSNPHPSLEAVESEGSVRESLHQKSSLFNWEKEFKANGGNETGMPPRA